MNSTNICNLALSHLGDAVTLASLDEPSVQAQLCKRYYPQALYSMIEMGRWDFATKRAVLALVDNPSSTWLYAYAAPGDMLNAIAVLPQDAGDDYSQSFYPPAEFPFPQGITLPPGLSVYVPQPFSIEQSSDGTIEVILTNVEFATLRYMALQSLAPRFSYLFTQALTYLLASMIAGPLIKGDEGSAKAASMVQMFRMWEAEAEVSDANQRRITPKQAVPWIVGR